MLDRVLQTPEADVPPTYEAVARYSDSPVDWRTRLKGACGTASIFALIGFAAFYTWRVVQPLAAEPAPLVVDLLSFTAPPEPVQEVPEGPQQVEQKKQKPEEREEQPEPPKILMPQP